ncbi:MAG TPA: alpha/beta hydrolase family protein [Pyrinomonadaceae bacterium]|nr:alpha/beta hydrolase family protein [Pyrinomonadaceae bacterium]
MNTNKHRFFNHFLWLIVAFSFSFSTSAQQTQTKVALPTTVQSYKLNSKLMRREMPYRVVLSTNYKNSNEKAFYPVVYLLHGLTGHFENWTDKTKLAEYAAKYNFIIVTPEGDNGWYTDSASVPNDKYESYIVQELIPEIDKNYRTLKDKKHRVIAGLSMGGYGSIKFGLKYPEMFSLVGSFSGALGAGTWAQKDISAKGVIAESLLGVFGIEDSQTRRTNDVFKLVRDLPDDKYKTLPFIYVDCGTEDFLYQNNRNFADLLVEKKIPHEFRQLPGKHDWRFWDSQIQEFLRLTERIVQ